MKYVGAHVSTTGGIFNAPLNAKEIGAKAFAMFTKNQLQWHAKPLTEKEIAEFKKNLSQTGIESKHILVHDSYLINVATPVKETRDKSVSSLLEEANRVTDLGLTLLNFHPGSHLNKIDEKDSLLLVSDAINFIQNKNSKVVLVIENTAGQGSNIGYKFEHLAYIIENVMDKDRVGVCIDTAHAFASGYDIRTVDGYNKLWSDFDSIIGLSYLKGMHLNDSKSECNSRVDRHENLGKGKIGWEPFKWIMNDKRLDRIPLILETVNDTLWKEEIKSLYSFINS